jgi:HD superfamily phosphohydrolase YqeK
VLHDALKDAPAELLDELASEWWAVPGLRHGPAAAVLAERHGEADAGILDAVRYHSVGYSQWEVVGKVLFLADYLESGRDFHTALHEQLAASVPSDLNAVVRIIAAERLAASVTYGFPLLPETVEFWNSLVCER